MSGRFPAHVGGAGGRAARRGVGRRASAFALVVALPLAPACLFTDPINRAPDAQITVESTGPYTLDDQVIVSARKSQDPDGNEVSVYWTARQCDDDGCDEPFIQDQPGSVYEPLVITPEKRGTLRVILRVEDEPYRAVGVEEHEFTVINRPPEAELQVQGDRLADGSYLVGRELSVVAEARDPDDDEPPALSFSLYPSATSDPNDVVWQAAGDGVMRLVPDAAGLWEVEVTADDGAGGTDTVSAAFQVADNTPPCIAATEPRAPGGGAYVVGASEDPKRFSVLAVEDELDPYPPQSGDHAGGEAGFRWRIASPETGGELVDVPGVDAPDFVLDPRDHAPGDLVSLRVEVSDREGADLSCSEDALTCSAHSDDCIQWTTWEVEIR